MSRLIERVPRIRELCKGKRVLDVGCCNHGDLSRLETGGFLHAEVARVASELLGLDNDPEGIRTLEANGFKVVQGDAENLAASNLGRFEVLVAGELIEHLSNAGLFLDGAFECLEPDGLLIATVPNAWSFTRLKQLYKRLDDKLWTHSQHTCWYSKATISAFFERHHFLVSEIGFCDLFRSKRWLKRLRDRLRLGWAMRPEFAESVFIVGRKGQKANSLPSA
jgi:2-polyprenyl-3-methyl-5-hydroxy-6-metoxy-1,4-benzoquinol methylase